MTGVVLAGVVAEAAPSLSSPSPFFPSLSLETAAPLLAEQVGSGLGTGLPEER